LLGLLLGGSLAAVITTSAKADTYNFSSTSARDVGSAIGPMLGLSVSVCSDKPITGRFAVNTSADLRNVFGSAGLTVAEKGPGQWNVGCDQADFMIPQGNPLIPPQFRPEPNFQSSAPPPPETRAVVPAKWVPRSVLKNLATVLGLKVLVDDVPDLPVLLAGPADVVQVARDYIETANRCPAQLLFEATVIEKNSSSSQSRDLGVRVGGSSIGFGTAGTTPNTGVSFSWLTGFLEASKSYSVRAGNSTLSSLLLVGQKATMQDGQSVPIRGATAVTDRESRTDVLYRNAGNNLAVQLLALDGGEALLSVDHNYSSVAGATDLGPTFAERHVTAVMRVPADGVTVLALSGRDGAESSSRKGILSGSRLKEAQKGGVFLAFKLTPVGCLRSELASDDGTRSGVSR
jgi:hypothetical protein